MQVSTPTLLYFGSFNPIHRGHIALAEAVLRAVPQSELWMIVSPHNPLKDSDTLAPELDRLRMAQLAVSVSPFYERIVVSDIEFSLPKPSASVTTLKALSARYPLRQFILLLGSDNVPTFDHWIDYRYILDHYPIWVYPREGFPLHTQTLDPAFHLLSEVPLLPQCATEIREFIRNHQPFDCELPDGVGNYIRRQELYGYSASSAFLSPKETPVAPQKSPHLAADASLEELDAAIALHPQDAALYMQRGRLYHRNGLFDKALNDFLQVLRITPHDIEAKEYCQMLHQIFACRYTELYNP